MSRRFVTDGSRLRVATTLRAMLVRGYSADDLRADASAGVVLGIVALPLSMALAIAAGAPPEYGLFTAIVAGIVIAVFGGSMHSVSGPTAAFVVLLAPVTARYGVQGLLLASLMAGLILIAMGLLRLGGLIQFVPHPVTTGFTAGIGVVIAVLQLGDFIGVGRLEGDRIWERLADLGNRLPDARWQDITIGVGDTCGAVVVSESQSSGPGTPGRARGRDAARCGTQSLWLRRRHDQLAVWRHTGGSTVAASSLAI